MVGMLETHLRFGSFDRSVTSPVLSVPSAKNWPFWPVAESDCEPGMIFTAVIDCNPELSTVKVVEPVATVVSAFKKTAVMVVLPLPIAVAKPGVAPPHVTVPLAVQIVATCELLAIQVTLAVSSKVEPPTFVPIARNWLVCVGALTDGAAGVMESVTMSPPVPPPPPPAGAVTVMLELVVTTPANPCAVAVTVVDPAIKGDTTPVSLTVATPALDEVHVNPVVTLFNVGWDPLPKVPITVN